MAVYSCKFTFGGEYTLFYTTKAGTTAFATLLLMTTPLKNLVFMQFQSHRQ